jgi:hypothetical protein
MAYLTAFIELFRFVKRYRQRADARLAFEAQERAEERAHQRLLLETIFNKMVESQRVQADSLMAIADAGKAQAGVMQTWIEGFRVADTSPAPPSVVRDDEQWVKEQMRLKDLGLGDLADFELPPEFKLAFDEFQREAQDFDREGSDL